MSRIMEEIMQEARQEVREETKRKIACRMIQKGKLSYEDIAYYQDLTLEEVKKLADELSESAAIR